MFGEDSLWDEVGKMRRQLDRLFGGIGDFSTGKRFRFKDEAMPNYRNAWTELKETADAFVLVVELPGIEKEDIKLQVRDHALEIKAEKKQEKEQKDEKKGEYHYARGYAGFYRTIELPENADTSKVEAIFKNGVLKVSILKKHGEVDKQKTVTIR